MSIRRFMIHSGCIRDGSAVLDSELFRHVVRVLRLAEGDALTLVDEQGCEHTGVLDHVTREHATVRVEHSTLPQEQDPNHLRITICQALPKGEKIDLILQKGTELGAHDFWLFGGQRSVARIREDQIQGKLDRWNRIVAEAARQCGSRTVPSVRWFPAAGDAAGAASQNLRLILWEDERTNRLNDALAGVCLTGSIIVAIGPEGGFDPSEKTRFEECGFQSISLGARILRTETAAIAITSILQYISGDI